jgi:hypothetical protein
LSLGESERGLGETLEISDAAGEVCGSPKTVASAFAVAGSPRHCTELQKQIEAFAEWLIWVQL